MKCALIFLLAAVICPAQGVISTVAGNGTNDYLGDNGPALSASMHPNGVTVDAAGNIYIADLSKSVIRKVDTTGIITTVAGFDGEKTQFSGDNGPATQASIYISSNHDGLAVDSAGNLYIADDGHQRIRKVDTHGIITTVAGNGKLNYSGDGVPATSTSLYRPSGVAVDQAGNLYIADTNNARIRKVDTNGIISTVAGNGGLGYMGDGGPANAATLFYPMDVALDAAGNIYIADQNANVIRRVDAITGIITTVAGNGNVQGPEGDGGLATNAILDGPYSVAVDGAGNIYIAEYVAHRVRKVDPKGIITTAVGAVSTGSLGDGGPPTSAQIVPAGLAVDSAGNYYIADEGHNRIRKVTIGARVPGLLASVPSLYFSETAGGNTANAQIVTVYTTGSVPLGLSVAASTASGGDWLKVTSPGGNTPVQITVSINSQAAANTYKGNIVLTPTAPDLPSVTIPVTYLVTTTPPARPVISSVVNAAGYQNSIAPNTFATIKGTNLASTTDTWDKTISNGQLPASLDGVTVLFDGKPGYVSYISSTQINVLVPNITSTSLTSVVVSNSGAKVTSIFNTPAAQYSPAFFSWPNNQAVATHQDYSYAVKNGTFATLPTVAAKPGEVIILWGTGFGATNPAYLLGYVTPSDQTYATSATPTVTIDNIPATVYGAALASGFAGLYQIAIQVPPDLGNGDWPIIANIGGVQSPTGIVLTVQQ
ncbi:MAG TPA: IPT/TIG domain-containing protein [Bryobacteraceae bacterium]|nr:IPT/TIG domain-containing protein [Bryobacteraceae bacterium]